MTTLTFQNKNLSVINQNNQLWMTVTEIGNALGYSDPFKSVKNIYDRHADEFTPNMTALINMQTNGGMQKVRIFSLRGAHLIGMLSHTKVAKDFRKWVLDILDKEVERQKPKQLALPEPKTYNRTLTALELEDLLWLWFINHNMLNFINSLIEPLEKIGSNFLPSAHSQSREYGEFNHYMAPLIDKLIANAELGSANQLPKRTLEQVLGKTTTQRGYHLTKR
ncbi:P22AR C-terminal domain-containing protein [Avibacterium paragallinarum]|uniref:Uncharacterized phage-encoded protein n=1 Tax=Avibacterium paragallinarum TaxID=728 RepID=A0A380X274_AVIPA|nr:P22AR C-terminal domain-containing protein [Avibacterium paragallinarum]SUU97331.1 Uncharacterized phage-encoded protein [Avibacterium paragallinarum]